MSNAVNIRTEENLRHFIDEHIAEWNTYPLWLLHGPLGVGKTTFVKHVISSLDPSYDHVQSPSFTLVNCYQVAEKNIFHVDLYRLQDVDIADLGLEDVLGKPDTVVIIEWPEHALALPRQFALEFDFKFVNNTERTISIHHA